MHMAFKRNVLCLSTCLLEQNNNHSVLHYQLEWQKHRNCIYINIGYLSYMFLKGCLTMVRCLPLTFVTVATGNLNPLVNQFRQPSVFNQILFDLTAFMLNVLLFQRQKVTLPFFMLHTMLFLSLCLPPLTLSTPRIKSPPSSQWGLGAMRWWIVRCEAGGRTM